MNSGRSHLLNVFASEATQAPEIDDSFAIAVARTSTSAVSEEELSGVNVDEAYGAFFNGAPRWVGQLMALRNKIVGRLGFDVGHPSNDQPATTPAIGDVVGVFEIKDRSDSEILMGNDDSHFRFRVSLQVLDSATPSEQVISMTTVGYSLTRLGRMYLRIVRPFHAIVAKRMTRSIVAELAQLPA